MDKKTKGIDSHRAWDRLFAGAEDNARSDGDVRQTVFLVVFHHQFVLF